MKIVPACLCGRGNACGLITGKLDAIDYEKVWLPVGYMNRIRGASFLEMTKETGNFVYPDRREAVKVYLSDIKKNNNRF